MVPLQPTLWNVLKEHLHEEKLTLIEKISDLSGSPNHPIQDIKILRKLLDNDRFKK